MAEDFTWAVQEAQELADRTRQVWLVVRYWKEIRVWRESSLDYAHPEPVTILARVLPQSIGIPAEN